MRWLRWHEIDGIAWQGVDEIGPWLFERLGVVRVYTKIPGAPADASAVVQNPANLAYLKGFNAVFDFDIQIRLGAGAYICGEESALIESMEGKAGRPRNRPPFPVTHGFEDKPTAVNNVETLASVPAILERGADWYAGLGAGEHKGKGESPLQTTQQRGFTELNDHSWQSREYA